MASVIRHDAEELPSVVTGAQCLASCVLTPHTVADGLCDKPGTSPAVVKIEHPSGMIEVTIGFESGENGFKMNSAGLMRTARLLARGEVFIRPGIWQQSSAEMAD